MDNGTLIVAALAILLVGGYAVGAILNARLMAALTAGLREALSWPGGRPRVQRPGRSIVRVESPAPVRGAGPVVATARMAPREAIPLWIMWALQGRGDVLDVRAHLDAPPSGAGLVADTRHRTGRAAIRAAVAAGGTRRDVPGTALATVAYDAAGHAAMERMAPVAAGVANLVLVELRAVQPRLTFLVSLRGMPRSLSSLRQDLQRLVGAARGRSRA